eukprot:708686-Pleurochrysis_carterae.AAC.2
MERHLQRRALESVDMAALSTELAIARAHVICLSLNMSTQRFAPIPFDLEARLLGAKTHESADLLKAALWSTGNNTRLCLPVWYYSMHGGGSLRMPRKTLGFLTAEAFRNIFMSYPTVRAWQYAHTALWFYCFRWIVKRSY